MESDGGVWSAKDANLRERREREYSTAVTTDLSGVRTSEVRYMPWGEDRYTYGTAAGYCRATTVRYTGQRRGWVYTYKQP